MRAEWYEVKVDVASRTSSAEEFEKEIIENIRHGRYLHDAIRGGWNKVAIFVEVSR